MSFEQVDNPNPITVPAIPEKVYNKLWITKIIVESPRPDQKATASVEGLPWDGVSGVLYEGPIVSKTINDIFGLAAQDMDVATAINTLLIVVNKYGV